MSDLGAYCQQVPAAACRQATGPRAGACRAGNSTQCQGAMTHRPELIVLRSLGLAVLHRLVAQV